MATGIEARAMSTASSVRILITSRLSNMVVEHIRSEVGGRGEVLFRPSHTGWRADELAPLLADVDAVMAGGDHYNDVSLRGATRLRIIARTGAGIDRVDVAAASRQRIYVTHTPGLNAPGVADLTLGLMLALVRGIPELNNSVKGGAWQPATGRDLAELRLGIIGCGAVGSQTARRASAFGMEVRGFDPNLDAMTLRSRGIIPCTLLELLGSSDVVALHLPITPTTQGLVDQQFLNAMPPGSYLINTARGELVDEVALLAALESGHIAGAGLDVFAVEPPDATSRALISHPRVVVTPHIAGATQGAIRRNVAQALESILAAVDGRVPPRAVNADAFSIS